MFTPKVIILTSAEMRDFLRKANEGQVASHRAEYRARLLARKAARVHEASP